MPVTFDVATHDAEPVTSYQSSSKMVEDFFKASCYSQWKASGEILQTSVAESDLPTLRPQKNGFVHTIMEAYGQHHHLNFR